MVIQHESSIMSFHAHFAVEKIAACEVKKCESILIDRVVLEIDAVVPIVTEDADSHVVD